MGWFKMKTLGKVLRSIFSLLYSSLIFIALPYLLKKSVISKYVTLGFLENMNFIYLIGSIVIILSTIRFFFDKKGGLILSILYFSSILLYLFYVYFHSSIIVKVDGMDLMVNYVGIILIFILISLTIPIFAYIRYFKETHEFA